MTTHPTRRTVLQAAGAAGAATAAAGSLAACGSGSGSSVASQVAGAA